MKKLFRFLNVTVLLTFVFLLSVNCITAQFSSDYEKYKSKYPNSHMVRLNNFTSVEIKLQGNKIIIKEDIIEEDILLSKSAQFSAKEELSYSSFVSIENLKYPIKQGFLVSISNFQYLRHFQHHLFFL